MRILKLVVCLGLLVGLFTSGVAQAWRTNYEKGLAQAKRGQWADARASFLNAIKSRPADTMAQSTVGEGVADRRPWRQGAPYSPNFAAAYCSFKLAAEAQDKSVRATALKDAIEGFTGVISKSQISMEALLFLAASHAANSDAKSSGAVQEQLNKLNVATAFKVDREVIEYSDLQVLIGGSPGTSPDPTAIALPGADNAFGIVPILDFKYALIIGNTKGSGQAFASGDADLIKDALIRHAGYSEQNVLVLKDATTEQIMAASKELADRMPDNGVLFFFFSGMVAHDPSNTTDYLMGVNNSSPTAYSEMVSKSGFYKSFVAKGANIFAFYQVDRPRMGDVACFGQELIQVGKIAQCHGAAPGEINTSTTVDGVVHGTYASAISKSLSEIRSNRIPILDFAWSTFDKVRRGGEGAGAQTPTLPVFINMTGAARF